MKKRFNKGFTFIEMLVVITIIAVLTGVGVTSYRAANKKARDGKRKADLEQIRAALELYRADEGAYPTVDWPGTGGQLDSTSGVIYMAEVPDDPVEGYDYYYSSDGSTYSLCAALETETSGSCVIGSSCGTGTCNYMINNPL